MNSVDRCLFAEHNGNIGTVADALRLPTAFGKHPTTVTRWCGPTHYAAVLTEIPPPCPFREKMYEVILEGSLLGRETCGGGIGVSLQNSIVVLSTSLPMGLVQRSALQTTMPCFVETLKRWRTLLKELV